MKDYSKYFKMPSLTDARKRTKDKTKIVREDLIIPSEVALVGKNKKYFIRTYGCQGNEADSEVIAGILETLKYERTDNVEEASFILLNTCSVRENADNKVFGELGALKRHKQFNPDILICLSGCMPQQESVVKKVLKTYPQVDIILGTHNINRLPVLIKEALYSKERVVEVFSIEGEVYENLPVKRNSKIKAWVNIMYGCDKFCTYCIVPYTRGKERSRLKEDIVKEVKDLKEKGYKEITLLGQNVNAYGNDLKLGYNFANLLKEVADTKIERIQFITSHPWNFTDEMIDVIANNENIMPYIHLPLQSGDDEILKKMGRKYTAKEYKELYYKIRKRVKNSVITTDIIVGFPGETNEQFKNTLDLVKELKYDSAFTFIYSPREGTPASKMLDNVSLKEKKERFNKLVEIVKDSALKHNEKYEGKEVMVLVEGVSKKNENVLSGYSHENKLVNFKGKKSSIGKIVKVKIQKAKTWTLEGEQVE